MPSDIMNKVLETERLCDERKAEAKEEAGAIVSEAEKKARSMLREADAFAKAKAKAILGKAGASAENSLSAGSSEAAAQTAELKNSTKDKFSEAVRQTALYLLQLA